MTVSAIFFFITHLIVFGSAAKAGNPAPAEVMSAMDAYLQSLTGKSGWADFVAQHDNLCGRVDEKDPSHVGVQKITLKVAGSFEEEVGLSCRSLYIRATPKTVVQIVEDPKFFQSLYGLDKTAVLGPPRADGSFDSRVFKLVPGVETQDYVLSYHSQWDHQTWTSRARQTKDDHVFALRDIAKMIEATSPSGTASIQREVVLFFPQRWWLKMRIVDNFVQKITADELKKLNWALKCAAEKVPVSDAGVALMTTEIASSCHKSAESEK